MRYSTGTTIDVADTTAIVTSYNHQAYVEQCLDSIAAQTVRPRSILVFDDQSTDDTAAVIEDWIRRTDTPAVLHRTPVNSGICAVMNRALELVRTATYFHIAADDWALPDRIEVQTRALEQAERGVAFVASDFIEVDAGGLLLAEYDVRARLEGLTGYSARRDLHLRLLDTNFVPAPAVMVVTDAVRDVGGYDESLEFEDYDLWLRLSAQYGVEHAACIAAAYRVVPTSLSRRSDRAIRMLDSEARMVRKHYGDAPENDAVIDSHLERIAQARDRMLLSEQDAGGPRPQRRRRGAVANGA